MQRRPDPVVSEHNFTPSSLSGRQRIHPAISYLRQLSSESLAKQLEHALSDFNQQRTVNQATFVEGIKVFTALANKNPSSKGLDSRKYYYGHSYLGLHYNNDLVQLWNNSHPSGEPLKASDVTGLTPTEWDYIAQDGYPILIYKGQQPAEALDKLLKGPTVIDCGMFSQLSLWFGIRYMLGNALFNQYFGRAPFFITQVVYQAIDNNHQPYAGNPLFCFLSKTNGDRTSVTLKHWANTPLYVLKHPGGNYNGENCLVMNDAYYIFDPLLSQTQGLTNTQISNLLIEAFNAEPTVHDEERLALYATQPKAFHLKLGQTYSQLIAMAYQLKAAQITKEEWQHVSQPSSCELNFDFDKFLAWTQRLNQPKHSHSEIVPCQPINHALLSPALLDVIPFENKLTMDFARFKQDTLQQQQLFQLSQQFCRSVLAKRSQLVILTGKAGVGKTASAVCAAKALAYQGKKVVWISEVMVNGWAEQAQSMAELSNCDSAIEALLSSNPDVVFLDDDNLAGFSGRLLLEKIYTWYVTHAGKGLFITSNEPITFKECFGYKLDGTYHYPPFSDYSSPQYVNWHHQADLSGESLRIRREGQSIGAIVSATIWQTQHQTLGAIELVPGFDEDNQLAPIRCWVHKTNGSVKGCLEYQQLSLVQQQWLEIYEVPGMFSFSGFGNSQYREPHMIANPRKFEKTNYKTIALEIREWRSLDNKLNIDDDSIDQLIRILNYAHDKGGRRIILINQTRFNAEELLNQIKQQFPQAERERTASRLTLLLCETEESIFNQSLFEGQIEPMEPKLISHESTSLENKTPEKFDSKDLENFFSLFPPDKKTTHNPAKFSQSKYQSSSSSIFEHMRTPKSLQANPEEIHHHPELSLVEWFNETGHFYRYVTLTIEVEDASIKKTKLYIRI